MDRLPDLSSLSHDEKDALIRALWAQVQALTARVVELGAKLGTPPKCRRRRESRPLVGVPPGRERRRGDVRRGGLRDGPAAGVRGRVEPTRGGAPAWSE